MRVLFIMNYDIGVDDDESITQRHVTVFVHTKRMAMPGVVRLSVRIVWARRVVTRVLKYALAQLRLRRRLSPALRACGNR